MTFSARWLAAWWTLAGLVTGRHLYLSTGCLHGDHDYCAGRAGTAGVKRPAECKFCRAGCRCRCHRGRKGRP